MLVESKNVLTHIYIIEEDKRRSVSWSVKMFSTFW